MGLRTRLQSALRGVRANAARGPPPRDVARAAGGTLFAVLSEIYKLAREMLVIPAQLWILAAEIIGGIVLRAWLRLVLPVLRFAWLVLVALYGLAARHVTPARAVAFVGLAAAVALVASQWLDYRSVTVGNDAYAEGLQAVAPAPDVTRDRAGEAHAWVMIPLAALGGLGIALAAAGRVRAAWFAVAAGVGAIAIAVGIDAPKGLDEGPAAVTYEGAEAQLLDGFWAQIACRAALAGTGLLLARRHRRDAVPARRPVRRPRPAQRPARLEGHAKLDARAEGGSV